MTSEINVSSNFLNTDEMYHDNVTVLLFNQGTNEDIFGFN